MLRQRTAPQRAQKSSGENRDGTEASGAAPNTVHATVRSPGRTLDQSERAEMESHFGADFSQVRIHDDAAAASSASDVGARAYTVGQHIVFRRGEYRPTDPTSRVLLAHELTHVVQQGNAEIGGGIAIGAVNTAAEHEADAASRLVASGHPSQVPLTKGPTRVIGGAALQRQPTTPVLGIEQLQPDIRRIEEELDSWFYDEEVEETVIGLLRKWCLQPGALDFIFDALSMPQAGAPEAATRYDDMLDDFDRTDEVRALRDGCSTRYRGRESKAQTRRAAQRKEQDISAEQEGGWAESQALPRQLPDRNPYAYLARRVVGGFQGIRPEDMTPAQRVIANGISQWGGPEAGGYRFLLQGVHWVTPGDRERHRQEILRTIAITVLEWAAIEVGLSVLEIVGPGLLPRLLGTEAEAATAAGRATGASETLSAERGLAGVPRAAGEGPAGATALRSLGGEPIAAGGAGPGGVLGGPGLVMRAEGETVATAGGGVAVQPGRLVETSGGVTPASTPPVARPGTAANAADPLSRWQGPTVTRPPVTEGQPTPWTSLQYPQGTATPAAPSAVGAAPPGLATATETGTKLWLPPPPLATGERLLPSAEPPLPRYLPPAVEGETVGEPPEPQRVTIGEPEQERLRLELASSPLIEHGAEYVNLFKGTPLEHLSVVPPGLEPQPSWPVNRTPFLTREEAFARALELVKGPEGVGAEPEPIDEEPRQVRGTPEEQGFVRYYRGKGSTARLGPDGARGNIIAIVEHTADPTQPLHFHVVRPPSARRP